MRQMWCDKGKGREEERKDFSSLLISSSSLVVPLRSAGHNHSNKKTTKKTKYKQKNEESSGLTSNHQCKVQVRRRVDSWSVSSFRLIYCIQVLMYSGVTEAKRNNWFGGQTGER